MDEEKKTTSFAVPNESIGKIPMTTMLSTGARDGSKAAGVLGMSKPKVRAHITTWPP